MNGIYYKTYTPSKLLRPYISRIFVFESKFGLKKNDFSLIAPNGETKLVIPYKNNMRSRIGNTIVIQINDINLGGMIMQENKLEKKQFFLKAVPKRPTFQLDMTEEERSMMYQHIAYWTSLMNKGFVAVFGPVFDPNGGYGIGVVEVESVEQVQSFIANDPAVVAGLFTQEFCPMQAMLPSKS